MGVRGRLWNQDVGAAFDEVVAADIGHDLCARKDLGVDLPLDLAELLPYG